MRVLPTAWCLALAGCLSRGIVQTDYEQPDLWNKTSGPGEYQITGSDCAIQVLGIGSASLERAAMRIVPPPKYATKVRADYYEQSTFFIRVIGRECWYVVTRFSGVPE